MSGMFRYTGPAVISLEGREALEFRSNGYGMLYNVGGAQSRISIHDLRADSMEAARLAMSGVRTEAFTEVFSDLAWVEVEDGVEGTRITVREYHSAEGTPVTLWVGVLNEGMLSLRRSFWAQIQKLDARRIAFAALLDD